MNRKKRFLTCEIVCSLIIFCCLWVFVFLLIPFVPCFEKEPVWEFIATFSGVGLALIFDFIIKKFNRQRDRESWLKILITATNTNISNVDLSVVDSKKIDFEVFSADLYSDFIKTQLFDELYEEFIRTIIYNREQIVNAKFLVDEENVENRLNGIIEYLVKLKCHLNVYGKYWGIWKNLSDHKNELICKWPKRVTPELKKIIENKIMKDFCINETKTEIPECYRKQFQLDWLSE